MSRRWQKSRPFPIFNPHVTLPLMSSSFSSPKSVSISTSRICLLLQQKSAAHPCPASTGGGDGRSGGGAEMLCLTCLGVVFIQMGNKKKIVVTKRPVGVHVQQQVYIRKEARDTTDWSVASQGHRHRLFQTSNVNSNIFLKKKKHAQPQNHNWYLHFPSSNPCVVNHLKSAFLPCEGPQGPVSKWKYTQLYLLGQLWAWFSVKSPLSGTVRSQRFAWKVNLGIFPGSPQDVNRGQIHLGVPGERRGGRLVEMPHQEDPDGANKEHRCHDKKTDPVNHPGNKEPLFILLNWWEISSYVYLKRGQINRKVDLTFWKLLCCLAVSAICLQEATHFFTSGETFARLIASCSGVPPSSPSSVCKYSCIYSCTGTFIRCDRAPTLTQFLQNCFHQSVSLLKPWKHELWPSRLHCVFFCLGDECHGAAASAGNQEDSISICGQSFPAFNLRSAVLVWCPGPHLHLQQTGQDI